MRMKFQLTPKIYVLIHGAGLALAIGAIVALNQSDTIVHSTLYEYGLRFDAEWAIPYWTFERLALVLLGCVAGVNGFLIAYIVLTRRDLFSLKLPSISKELSVKEERKAEKKAEKKPEGPAEEKEDGVEIASLPMVCNKCGKVFTQPLCMFDFRSGKPRLVNVCPYCNTILAVSGNSKMK